METNVISSTQTVKKTLKEVKNDRLEEKHAAKPKPILRQRRADVPSLYPAVGWNDFKNSTHDQPSNKGNRRQNMKQEHEARTFSGMKVVDVPTKKDELLEFGVSVQPIQPAAVKMAEAPKIGSRRARPSVRRPHPKMMVESKYYYASPGKKSSLRPVFMVMENEEHVNQDQRKSSVKRGLPVLPNEDIPIDPPMASGQQGPEQTAPPKEINQQERRKTDAMRLSQEKRKRSDTSGYEDRPKLKRSTVYQPEIEDLHKVVVEEMKSLKPTHFDLPEDIIRNEGYGQLMLERSDRRKTSPKQDDWTKEARPNVVHVTFVPPGQNKMAGGRPLL